MNIALLSHRWGLQGVLDSGDHVMIGGQAGLVDHLTIGDQVRIASGAGVTNHVATGDQTVGGRPAVDHNTWRKAQVLQYQLPDMRNELRSLRKEVEDLKRRLPKPFSPPSLS